MTKIKSVVAVSALFLALTTVSSRTTDALAHAAYSTIHATQSQSAIYRNQSVSISGYVSPNLRAHVVYLQRYYASAWRTVQTRHLSSTSRFAFTVTGTGGLYPYRIYHPAQSGWHTSVSAVRYVRVLTVADALRHSAVVSAMKRAAAYYRPAYVNPRLGLKNGWSWATYAHGLQELFQHGGDWRNFADGLGWGRLSGWSLTAVEPNPDAMKAGQAYYDLHAVDASVSLSAMDAAMARDLADLPVGQYDWIDALFMGLPNWTRWAVRTDDNEYLNKLDALYLWARDEGATGRRCAGKPFYQPGLFDPTEKLWYRDCTFIGQQDVNGEPIFWARGNAWVIAAMAQVLETFPPGAARAAKYASMLKTMAARLVPLQGSDGFWRSSLADPQLYPQPETSGTALITYALAYGIRSGLLDAATYLPVVTRAWDGLATVSLQPSGFVTNCQGGGNAPGGSYPAKAPRVAPTSTSAGTVIADSPPFCVGAFLLAGSMAAQLVSSPSAGRPATATAQQPGNGARGVNDGDVTTRWSAVGFPQSVTVDLGATYSLNNAMVVPYQDRAYRYRIQTSPDRLRWQTVVDRTTNTATGSRLDDFAIVGNVKARYVRLTVTGVYGVRTTWVSIPEFAVYRSN